MVNVQTIAIFLDEYLQTALVPDSSWNGLQFQGKDEVTKIAGAVDASRESFQKAVECGADMLLVHHGQFWKGSNPSFSGWNKERLDILYKNQLSLYASHLPLDRHPDFGNNAQILKLLDAQITEEFLKKDGINIGWIGKFKHHQSFEEITKKLQKKLAAEGVALNFGTDEIITVAVCSGGGGYSGFFEAQAKGVDLYISGDPVEIYSTAKDSKMNVIFAGHYATETVGIKAMLNFLANKFNVETEFIDIPTGL